MTNTLSSASSRAVLMLAALIGALFVLVLVTWPGHADAASYPPSTGCAVSTQTVDAGPGKRITVIGSGYAPDETVALSIPSASAALGSVRTTSAGTFRGSFIWPASVTGKSAVVEAAAPSTTCSFTIENGVDAASAHRAAGSGSGSSGTSGLASTGFQTLTASLIAVGLIGGGVLFLALARRKRA